MNVIRHKLPVRDCTLSAEAGPVEFNLASRHLFEALRWFENPMVTCAYRAVSNTISFQPTLTAQPYKPSEAIVLLSTPNHEDRAVKKASVEDADDYSQFEDNEEEVDKKQLGEDGQ